MLGTPHPNGIPLSEKQRAYGEVGLFGVILFYFFASSDFCSASFAYCVFFQVYASPFFLLFFFF